VMWSLAALAFVAIYFFKVPFPIIILAAAIIGFIGGKLRRDKFLVIRGHGSKPGDAEATVIDDNAASAEHTRPTLARALKVCATWLALWWLPIGLLALWLGTSHTLFREAIFFSKASMVTFGGAYAVLPYVSQQAVEHYSWLSAGQMLDGLGLAETTPGPLIMVLQFVGFLGGWNQPGTLSPLLAATLGAIITTWTTFLPCFLWIFLGAPHIEQLRGNQKLTAALSAITAAVVGVILNLAVWFGAHVLFPTPATLDAFALAVSCIAFLGITRWKWDVIAVITAAGFAGLAFQWLR
ncbi:MAG: chromate transporter, partial [Chthoniobacterales bacterium]